MASLSDVAQGDLHVKAHNDERAAINSLTAFSEANKRTSIFDGVKRRLDDGRSTVLSYLTDSTGNDPSTEHIGLAAARLAQLYPNFRVEFNGYDNGTPNNYTEALRVLKQAGTNERRITFAGTANSALVYGLTSLASNTGDLDIRARVSASSWAAVAPRTIVNRFNGGSNRSWWWYHENGSSFFAYTTDGATIQTRSIPLSAFTLVDGQVTNLRVVLDVDNGASGHDVKFYQSTDNGVTWVQKGSTITTAGTIALFNDSVTQLIIGGRNGGGTAGWVGDVYRVEIRYGIDGAIVAPTLPELWSPSSTAYDGVLSGDPVIQIWAGAASGWGLPNFVANSSRMIPVSGAHLFMMGTSHNENLRNDASVWVDWDIVMAAARARIPGAAIGVFNENPQAAPQNARQIAAHQDRCRQIQTYASSRAYEFYDVFNRIYTDSHSTAELSLDGVHPTALGSQIWANVILSRWGISQPI